jgi:hypothetical protein
MTTETQRPFGLNITHRATGIRSSGSTWYLETSPACPVIVVAAIAARFGLTVEQTPAGRLALYSQLPGASPPNLDDVAACATATVQHWQRELAGARRLGGWRQVVPFPLERSRRGGRLC